MFLPIVKRGSLARPSAPYKTRYDLPVGAPPTSFSSVRPRAPCRFVLPALSPAKVLAQLFDDERTFSWRGDPLAASSDGIHAFDDRLPTVTPAAQERRLMRKSAISAAAPRDRTAQAQRAAAGELRPVRIHGVAAADARPLPGMAPADEQRQRLSQRSPLHGRARQSADGRGVRELHRALSDVPRYFDENIANMRDGARDGFTLPAAILDGVSEVISSAQYDDAEKMPLWRPFARFPHTVPETRRVAPGGRGKAALTRRGHSGLSRVPAFLRDRIPEGRAEDHRRLGASRRAASITPTSSAISRRSPMRRPKASTRSASAEVARIRAEMDSILSKLDHGGDFAGFLDFLRANPEFRAKTGEELLREAAWIAKEIDGKLPAIFRQAAADTLRGEARARGACAQLHRRSLQPGPLGAAGEYWVNTLRARKAPPLRVAGTDAARSGAGSSSADRPRPRARRPAAIPAELLPHAFGEGWALYCEKLGEEMGVYHTPYQAFGRLTYEMWRACRLVVDTGMHALGWTRERAQTFLATNTALSLHEVRTEIDRYISWPGQALAYKIGELKIVELRRRAEAALGAAFDVRAFHDAVLENGGVTLSVLERRIDVHIRDAGRRK